MDRTMKVKKEYAGFRVVLFKPEGAVVRRIEDLTPEEVEWWRKMGGAAEVQKYFEDEPTTGKPSKKKRDASGD